jgi:hypothetical protein
MTWGLLSYFKLNLIKEDATGGQSDLVPKRVLASDTDVPWLSNVSQKSGKSWSFVIYFERNDLVISRGNGRGTKADR